MSRERKPGAWLPHLYYYLAAAIGLIILLVGLIGGLRGLVTAALPEISNEVRYPAYGPYIDKSGNQVEPTQAQQDKAKAEAIERARIGGYADALYGAVAVLVGAPVFVWHLRQARRRESELLGAPDPSATDPNGPGPNAPGPKDA